jgi:hypothetical protein
MAQLRQAAAMMKEIGALNNVTQNPVAPPQRAIRHSS